MEIKSILTDDFEHCYICGAPYPQIHHIMNKYDKERSEKWGLLVPLCMTHHTGMFGVHTHPDLMLEMRKTGQKKFEELYGHDKWMEEFGKSYL